MIQSEDDVFISRHAEHHQQEVSGFCECADLTVGAQLEPVQTAEAPPGTLLLAPSGWRGMLEICNQCSVFKVRREQW